MKTISEIELQIKALVYTCESLSDNITDQEKKKNKIRKQISFLRKCILYIESNPRPEFVVQMKNNCKKQLMNLDVNYSSWTTLMGDKLEKIKLPRKYYYKEVAADENKRIKVLNNQLRMLNYLLS